VRCAVGPGVEYHTTRFRGAVAEAAGVKAELPGVLVQDLDGLVGVVAPAGSVVPDGS
jgi:hypothetical protein